MGNSTLRCRKLRATPRPTGIEMIIQESATIAPQLIQVSVSRLQSPISEVATLTATTEQ